MHFRLRVTFGLSKWKIFYGKLTDFFITTVGSLFLMKQRADGL